MSDEESKTNAESLSANPAAADATETFRAAKKPLTKREGQVARLVAEGMKNEQIAAQLHISEGSVKKMKSHARVKLGLARKQPLTAASLDPSLAATALTKPAESKKPRIYRRVRTPATVAQASLPQSNGARANGLAVKINEAATLSPGQQRQVEAYVRMGFSFRGIAEEAKDARLPLGLVRDYVGTLATERGLEDKPLAHLADALRKEEKQRLQRPLPESQQSAPLQTPMVQ